MAEDKLSTSIQESIATAITLIDDENTQLICSLIDPDLLDPPLNDIVINALEYRKKYKKAPGKAHIDDIFAYALEDPKHKQFELYNRFLRGMLHTAENLNTAFVASEIKDFTRRRQIRNGIGELVNIYQQNKRSTTQSLEDKLREILKGQHYEKTNIGFTLGSAESLAFLDRSVNDHLNIGIPELDKVILHPAKKELHLFMAARNKGKSWYCTHVGKHAIIKGWKVVHYTLENSADLTAQRYFQTLYSGVRRKETYYHTKFEGDTKLASVKLVPNFIIEEKDGTTTFLTNKIEDQYYHLNNLMIREFPTSKLTFNGLERDLEELAIIHKFIPDMIIVDSPQLMRLNRQRENHIALDDNIRDIRGLVQERNMAGVVTQQGNRAGEKAAILQGHHLAQSIETLGTVDTAIAYSQTESEEKHGLARLHATKNRNEIARFTILITQHYASGQFYMDGRFLTKSLQSEVHGYIGQELNTEEDEDDN